MSTMRIAAAALIVLGLLGLLYGGFSYTRQTQQVKLGPIELSVAEQHDIDVPIWAGVAAVVAGGLLLGIGARRG